MPLAFSTLVSDASNKKLVNQLLDNELESNPTLLFYTSQMDPAYAKLLYGSSATAEPEPVKEAAPPAPPPAEAPVEGAPAEAPAEGAAVAEGAESEEQPEPEKEPEEVGINKRVQVKIIDLGDGWGLPQWQLSDEPPAGEVWQVPMP